MEPFEFTGKLMQGSGFGYLLIPASRLDMDEGARIKLLINGRPYTTQTQRLEDGTHQVLFNRESLYNLGLEIGQTYTAQVEVNLIAPQLSDLDADLLIEMQRLGVEENFKRLPPQEQYRLLDGIRSAGNQAQRDERVAGLMHILQEKDNVLPRGDSL